MQTIIGVLLIFISLLMLYYAGNLRDENDIFSDILTVVGFILFCVSSTIIHIGKPTAMDVYKGKTTLQITYKNNIPIDSTVVYK